MSATEDFDLVTIGAGSGGVRASRLAASLGARVSVVEAGPLGGTCVNLGCVPKKLLSYAAHFADDFVDARGFGWDAARPAFDWAALRDHKNREIARLNGVYGRLLADDGGELVEGRARIVDPHTVEVGGRRLSARVLLVATGSRPRLPEARGVELTVTSDAMFHLDALPNRALVVGGGYIAVEFAGILAGLGVDVALVHRGPRVLRGFDEDVRRELTEGLARRGIELHLERTVEALEGRPGDLVATLSDGSELRAGLVLCATGRVPNVEGLGLEEVGVALRPDGAIAVDAELRTSVPSIHALGDVIGRIALTPVALAEGTAFARSLFGGRPTKVDYENVPSAVFSQPPVGTVGLGEAEARARHGAIDVYVSHFRPLKHTLSGRDEHTMMKLVVDRATDRVLGCHMVGADAPEIVQGVAIAIRAGATKAVFDETIGVHPTAAEELVTMRTKRADDARG